VKTSTANIKSRPRGRPRDLDKSGPSAKALEKGLVILQQLATSDGISLNDLSLDLDMPQSTLHRLLDTLQSYGFVTQSKVDARWSIGIECFRVGSAFPRAAKVIDLARPVLRNLFVETGETANLGIMDGSEIVFVAQHETDHAIRAFFRPGSRSSWHASGIGKVMMAFTPIQQRQQLINGDYSKYTSATLTQTNEFESEFKRIKAQGYSLDDEERFEGMRCVASPVFNSSGAIAAGISVSGPVSRMKTSNIEQIARATKLAGYELSRDLGAPKSALALFDSAFG